MLESLKRAVCEANLELVRKGLVLMTWGNASGIDREQGLVVIKPSGVPYETMAPEHMVVVGLDRATPKPSLGAPPPGCATPKLSLGAPPGSSQTRDCNPLSPEIVPVEGAFKPSVDTPTHLALYKAWPQIGGVVHTHSHYATAWAQACRPIPCFGTTHADFAYGDIPVTDSLTAEEVAHDYERNIGEVIVRRCANLDPMQFPGVLVANHGPFAWGKTVEAAVENAIILEELARMALHTLQLSPHQTPIPQHLLDKHFLRKHGANAYYGQGSL